MSGAAYKAVGAIPQNLAGQCLPIRAYGFGCDYSDKAEEPLNYLGFEGNFATPCGITSRSPSQIEKHFGSMCWWCEQHRVPNPQDPVASAENKTLHAIADERDFAQINVTLRDPATQLAITNAIDAYEAANPEAGPAIPACKSRFLPMIPVGLADQLPLLVNHRAFGDGSTQTIILRPGSYVPCHACGDVYCTYTTWIEHAEHAHGLVRRNYYGVRGTPVRTIRAVPFKGVEEANLVNHQFKRNMLQSLGFVARPSDAPAIDMTNPTSIFTTLFNFAARPLTYDQGSKAMEVTWTNRIVYGAQGLRNPGAGVGAAMHNNSVMMEIPFDQRASFATGRDRNVTEVIEQSRARDLLANHGDVDRLQREVNSLTSERDRLRRNRTTLEAQVRDLEAVQESNVTLNTQNQQLEQERNEALDDLRDTRARLAELQRRFNNERNRTRENTAPRAAGAGVIPPS